MRIIIKRPTEEQIQIQLLSWVNQEAIQFFPELQYLFHVPNGHLRDERIGARLKRAGVKKGVPDLWLPVPKGPYHGLIIELKRDEKSATSPEQRKWIAALNDMGYRAEICIGLENARMTILNYLTLQV